MPTPVSRFVLGIVALATALVLSGAGAGIAAADPDESGNPTDTETTTEPGNPPESEPTVIPAPMPRSLPEQLRDLLQRPLSIFGNGRVPGAPEGNPTGAPPPGAKKSEPHTEGVIPRKPLVPEQAVPEPVEPRIPAWKSTSAADVRLPFTPEFSVPLPTLPGTEGLRLSIDLTDPYATYSTVQQTVNTFNSLLSDAYAPYNPFPPPRPEPSFRITEEEPVLDADGVGGSDPFSAGLPVLQAPMVVPPMAAPRGFPEPFRGGGARPEVIGGGTAGVQTPGIRGSVTPNGSVRAEPLPSGTAPPTGSPALRQGYPQYLRSAPIGQIAAVALPGLAGLLAITASGGVVGYRQANSGRYLRGDAVRFLR